jgi:thiol-disulfide isomerase/thioredoxin
MKTPTLFLAACLMASVAVAEDLTWPQLVQKPEVWPAQCTLNRTIKFQSGTSAQSGQKVDVLELQPQRIVVGTTDGQTRFSVKPEDTDFMALANAAWSKLTPQQRGLTYASLLRRQDLWPYRVTLTAMVELNGGSIVLHPGDKVILLGVEQDQLLVASLKHNLTFDVEPRQTDLLEQARKFISDKDGAPGRITEELQGKLVNPVTGATAGFDSKTPLRYIAFYRGAGWCPPCREFSPKLLKTYNELKPKHPEFEVVFLSADHSTAGMRDYVKEEGFPWLAVTPDRLKELNLVTPYIAQTIPQLIVMDAHGKVLVNTDQMDREVALKKMAALVDRPSGQN